MEGFSKTRQGNRGAFYLMTTLFFIWGFLTSMNDVLIPYFKNSFELSNFETSLVQFAFFGAYFIGSVAYFFYFREFG